MKYESFVRVESESFPGVEFTVHRMSFGRRLELTRRLNKLLGRLEFLSAGEETPKEQAERALIGGEIDREYIRWGLVGIEGLVIDGETATPEALVEGGPEDLVSEVLEAVRREAGLTEEEKKNCESHSSSREEARPGGNATNAAA